MSVVMLIGSLRLPISITTLIPCEGKRFERRYPQNAGRLPQKFRDDA